MLLERSYGQQLGKGYTFDIPMGLVNQLAPKLQTEIQYAQEDRKRRTPDLLLGKWCQQGFTPHVGTHVQFDELGRDPANRKPTDHRVFPTAIDRPQGPNDPPIYVVVELDRENRPPIHKIKAVILDASKATEIFQEVVRQHREEQALKREHEQNRKYDLRTGHMPKL